jgi:hypothetical protein
VADPFGGDLEGYREAWTQLDQLLNGVTARLEKGRLRDRR